MMLDPVHRVRDNHAPTVLQIFQPARIRIPLSVGEKLVLAVLVHGLEVGAHARVVVPLDRLHVRPALALRLGDEVLPQWQLHDGPAPEQLVPLAVPRVCSVRPRAAVFHLARFALHLDVTTDFRLGPAPEAVIGQQPDDCLVGAAGIGP